MMFSQKFYSHRIFTGLAKALIRHQYAQADLRLCWWPYTTVGNPMSRLKCSKISNTSLFLFSNKMQLFRAGVHKILVRIVNKEDPDQTASAEAV